MYYWSGSLFPIDQVHGYIEGHLESHNELKKNYKEKEYTARKPFSDLILDLPDMPSEFFHDIIYLTGIIAYELEQEFYAVFDEIKGVPYDKNTNSD